MDVHIRNEHNIRDKYANSQTELRMSYMTSIDIQYLTSHNHPLIKVLPVVDTGKDLLLYIEKYYY